MPVIEYQCLNCHHIYDEYYKTFTNVETEEAELVCPKCQSTDKHRLMGAPMVEFKGGGWDKKTISSTNSVRKNSTGSLRDQSQEIKESIKNTKSEDLYGKIQTPKEQR